MIGDLVQNDDTVPFAILFHDQPRVIRFGDGLSVPHGARQQANELLNVLSSKEPIFHGAIGYQWRKQKPFDLRLVSLLPLTIPYGSQQLLCVAALAAPDP